MVTVCGSLFPKVRGSVAVLWSYQLICLTIIRLLTSSNLKFLRTCEALVLLTIRRVGEMDNLVPVLST